MYSLIYINIYIYIYIYTYLLSLSLSLSICMHMHIYKHTYKHGEEGGHDAVCPQKHLHQLRPSFEYLSISFRKSTPPQNRQLSMVSSNSKQ